MVEAYSSLQVTSAFSVQRKNGSKSFRVKITNYKLAKINSPANGSDPLTCRGPFHRPVVEPQGPGPTALSKVTLLGCTQPAAGGQEAQTPLGREKTCTCRGTGVTWPAGPLLFPHTAFTQNTSSCLHLQKALESCPALLALPLWGIGSYEAWRASPIQCGGQNGMVKAHEGRIWRKPAATNPTTTRKPLINNQDGHHPHPNPTPAQDTQKVFLMHAATSTSISPIFRCQLVMSLDVAHHSSPCRGSAFSQRLLTSSRCSWVGTADA